MSLRTLAVALAAVLALAGNRPRSLGMLRGQGNEEGGPPPGGEPSGRERRRANSAFIGAFGTYAVLKSTNES